MPITANFSRKTMSRMRFKPNDAAISIKNVCELTPHLELDCKNALYVELDDSEAPITPELAKQIGDFIKKCRTENRNIYVNCHLGISRSGAVVEVLTKLGYTVLDSQHVAQRIPNFAVYNAIRGEFPELKQSWE